MPTKLLKCQRLQSGDSVGVIGFASPVKPEVFTRGKEFITGLGFKVTAPFDPSQFYGDYTHLFACNSIAERVKALQTGFNDENCKAIFSVRGGYGSAEMLPLIDFAALKRNPKIFVGFSDVTALLIALYQRAGLVVFHGASLMTAASRYDGNQDVRQSVDRQLALLKGDRANPFEALEFEDIGGKHEASGPLVGGNLSMLASLMGTPWQPVLDGHILFFEECGEEPYRIHRMLVQMKLAGMFKKTAGVLVGTCVKCDSEDQAKPKVRDAVRDIFKDASIPVLFGLPFGHGDANYPLPLGIKARIFQNKLELLEKSVI